MSLDLQSLHESGGFAGAPVRKEITFKNFYDEEITAHVWVRRLSYQSAVGDIQAIKTDGELAAARIASCIVDHRGEPLYQKHDITGVYEDGTPVLDKDGKPRGGFVESLLHALWRAIAEVNALGKPQSES